jgi:hypothetical protein
MPVWLPEAVASQPECPEHGIACQSMTEKEHVVMKTVLRVLTLSGIVPGLCLLLAGAAPAGAQEAQPWAEYNIYFGSLHNHSTLSDGDGSPSAAYAHARDVAGLDFFSLADHAENFVLTWPWEPSKYDELMNTAKSYYAPGEFVTLWGFE